MAFSVGGLGDIEPPSVVAEDAPAPQPHLAEPIGERSAEDAEPVARRTRDADARSLGVVESGAAELADRIATVGGLGDQLVVEDEVVGVLA